MRMARPWQFLTVAAVAAGALLRAVQYFANSSLWVDEAALSRNILDRSFAQLTQPLDYAQSAPIGFLFAQKIVTAFGSGELWLRAIPFAASLAALVLFGAMVRRLLGEFGRAVAITAFALGSPFIYFGAQAKPYATDVAVTLLLTWLLLRGIEKSQSIGYWILCGLIAVAACAVSHAATLVVGAHCVVLGWCYWRGQAPLQSSHFAAVQALWIIGIAISAWWSLASVSANDFAYLREVQSAWFVPAPSTFSDGLWLVRRMVDAFGWPQFAPPRLDGGLRYAVPSLYAIIALVGFVALWMRQRYAALVLLLPILAAVAASAMRMYPLGGRHTIYLLPLLIVAAAAGWEFIAVTVRERVGIQSPWLMWGAALLFLAAPIAAIARNLPPFYLEHLRPAAEYVRSHWQPGDALYVYYGAGQAFRYYAPRVGLADSGYVLGGCARGEPVKYLRELDTFRGRRRVWSLFTHATANGAELTLLRDYLDRAGPRLAAFERSAAGEHAGMGAYAYLHDLGAAGPPEILVPPAVDLWPMACYGTMTP
jgi:hypothetical protein